MDDAVVPPVVYDVGTRLMVLDTKAKTVVDVEVVVWLGTQEGCNPDC